MKLVRVSLRISLVGLIMDPLPLTACRDRVDSGNGTGGGGSGYGCGEG